VAAERTTTRQPAAADRRPVRPAPAPRAAPEPRATSPVRRLQERVGAQGMRALVGRLAAGPGRTAPTSGPAAPTTPARPQATLAPSSAALPASLRTAAGAGEPLPPTARLSLERSLGVDLGAVRVHQDAAARDAVGRIGARAVAHGSRIFLGPGERATDQRLMAHEVAHVVQQQAAPVVQRKARAASRSDPFEREADRVADAVGRGAPITVTGRTGTARPQFLLGWIVDRALGVIKDAANLLPGFRLFTIVLGVNPIDMSRVDRSPANILRGLVEVIPGGALIVQALENYGVFDRAGAWAEQQIRTLGMAGDAIRQALMRFAETVSAGDLVPPSGLWDRAKRIFTDPIGRMIGFVRGLASGFVGLVKDAILRPLAGLASRTPGWNLLIAVLGTNPVTGEPVPRNADTLIGGFMKLIGKEEVWENLKRANAVPRAWAWFQGALAGALAFVRAIPSQFMAALRSLEIADLVLLPRAFARVAAVFAGFVGQFISWAGGQVLRLLQIIFEVVAPGVMPYLQRAAGAFRTIIENPARFVGYLVRAGAQGFRQFAANFLTHLRAALIGWLTGTLSGAASYIPRAFTFVEILKFVLSVLGLTWQNIRQKLVRVIGEPTVRALETGFELVRRLVTEGPAGAWQQIQEGIGNLREMVVEQATSFVQSRVVQAAITTLLASLTPVGGFIRAVIATYDTIMFFVQRLSQIGQVAAAFIDSIAAIAAGNITAAANRVEQTLARTLTLVISFLAQIARVGDVGRAILNIVNRVRAQIDRALDRVVGWILAGAKRLFATASGKGKPSSAGEIQKRLDDAIATAKRALAKFAGRRVGAVVLRPLLTATRLRYRLSTLEPVRKGDNWYIRAEVNPAKEEDTGVKADSPEAKTLVKSAKQLAAAAKRAAENGAKAYESGLARESARRAQEVARPDAVPLPTKREGEEAGPGLDIATLRQEGGQDVLEITEVKAGTSPRTVKSRSSSRLAPEGTPQIQVKPGRGQAALTASDPVVARQVVRKEAVLVQGARLVQNQLSAITENINANLNKMFSRMREAVQSGKLDPKVLTRVQAILNGQGGIMRFVIDIQKGSSMSSEQLNAAHALIRAAFDMLMEKAEDIETKLEIVVRDQE
jgi:dolichol kinase